jgi:hypothetical protein
LFPGRDGCDFALFCFLSFVSLNQKRVEHALGRGLLKPESAIDDLADGQGNVVSRPFALEDSSDSAAQRFFQKVQIFSIRQQDDMGVVDIRHQLLKPIQLVQQEFCTQQQDIRRMVACYRDSLLAIDTLGKDFDIRLISHRAVNPDRVRDACWQKLPEYHHAFI